MTRHYINEFAEQDSVDQIFRASNKQLRPNRNGDLYLQVDLSDKTGTITARMWNASEKTYSLFENGQYVQVEGKTQIFQGTMQLIAKKITRVDPETVNEDDFIQVAGIQVDHYVLKMTDMLRGLHDSNLSVLGECYLMDGDFMAKFASLPAGVKHHHAYRGGLVQHVATMMELAKKVADTYPNLDRELLLMGAFLHDTGKTEELEGDLEFVYSDAGQLLGHIQLGISLLERKILEAEKLSGEPFPPQLALKLKHLIVSHHGEYEFGSPRLPMTCEALALHCIDLLDSKLTAFEQIYHDDLNTSSAWTTFVPSLQRKLYKGE